MDPTHESVAGSMTRLLTDWWESESVAMRRIHQEMFPRLCALARKHLGTLPGANAEAEDVVQSALGSLCRYLRAQPQPIDKTRDDIWRLLFRIVERKAARRRTRQTRGLGGGRLRTMTDLDLPHAPAQSEELLGSLSPAEFDLSISEVLERLEPLESQIVLLAMEGRTREEIATELGYSKRSIQRKLEIIRSVLSAFFQ